MLITWKVGVRLKLWDVPYELVKFFWEDPVKSLVLRYCGAQWMVKCSVSSRWGAHMCSFQSCDGTRPLWWWGRGQVASSSFMSPLLLQPSGEAFAFLNMTAHRGLWCIDWQLLWVVCALKLRALLLKPVWYGSLHSNCCSSFLPRAL